MKHFNFNTKQPNYGEECGIDRDTAPTFTARKEQQQLIRQISRHQLSDCLESLEAVGIPSDWAISLLPLIQIEMQGGDE